jgi:hypothetical protein
MEAVDSNELSVTLSLLLSKCQLRCNSYSVTAEALLQHFNLRVPNTTVLKASFCTLIQAYKNVLNTYVCASDSRGPMDLVQPSPFH